MSIRKKRKKRLIGDLVKVIEDPYSFFIDSAVGKIGLVVDYNESIGAYTVLLSDGMSLKLFEDMFSDI